MIIVQDRYDAKRGEEEIEATIEIHAPEADPKCSNGSTHRTLINVAGFGKPQYIYGEGQLQSLGLALSMLRVQIQMLHDSGWRFYYPGNRTPCDDLATLHIRDWVRG